MSRLSKQHQVEYVLVLDEDDAVNYQSTVVALCGNCQLRVVIGPHASVVPALNEGAEVATGDVLIYLSDDFECPQNWDAEIFKACNGRTDPWVLCVYDGIQRKTQTISILSRTYYKLVGHMYYPEYISMFADPDFTEEARARGVMIDAMHLTFKHNHYTTTGTAPDATYQRENRPEAWTKGEEVFKRRQASNFGVPK